MVVVRPDHIDMHDAQEKEEALEPGALEGHTMVVQILVTTPDLQLPDDASRNGMLAASSRARKEVV